MIGKNRNKKKTLADIGKKLHQTGKVLDSQDTQKVKGGKTRKSSIWNGCGGIIPQ